MAAYDLFQRPAKPGKVATGIWYVRWTDEYGRVHRKSTDTTKEREAHKRAPAIIHGQFAAPTIVERNEKAKVQVGDAITVAKLFRHCEVHVWAGNRSRATLASTLRILERAIGDEPITEITYPRLLELVEEFRCGAYGCKPMADSTINRKLATLGSALTEACKMTDPITKKPWLTGKPPMPVLEESGERDRVVSDAEEEAIFALIARRRRLQPSRDWQRYACLFRWLLDTGSRLSEILNLHEDRITVEVINGVERTAAIFPRYRRKERTTGSARPPRRKRAYTKNAKPRVLYLSDEIIKTLPYLRATALDGRLFPMTPSLTQNMWDDIRGDMIADGWKDADEIVQHSLRHTFATRAAISGEWTLEEISDWLGHSNLQITKTKYQHLLPQHRAHLVDRVNARAKRVSAPNSESFREYR